jgi:hypothetical protein
MNSEMRVGDWEYKIYCDKHRNTGRKFVKALKTCKNSKKTGEVI